MRLSKFVFIYVCRYLRGELTLAWGHNVALSMSIDLSARIIASDNLQQAPCMYVCMYVMSFI